jgi:general secretion pathway protein L
MKLRIYFSATWQHGNSPCPWVLSDDTGNVLQSGNSPLASLPKADEAIAIISSSRITCVSVKMPAQSRRRWEAALPFVAEEFTLTDPEENHVVPAVVQNQGMRSLFIVDKQWLHNMTLACHTAGINLRRAVPEMLIPALPPVSWVIVWDGNTGFMRTGLTSGIALDQGDMFHPPMTMTLSLKATTPPPQNIQIRFTSEATQNDLPQWPGLPVTLSLGQKWDWRTAPIPGDTLNLLWGTLAPKTKLHEWLPKLRPVAFILLAVILIETVGTNIEWGLLNHQKSVVTREMERTFRKTFGETSVIVNPPLQMQRNIAVLRHTAGLPDEADFLALLDQASGTLSTLPAGSVSALHYESGRLDIDLKLRNEAEVVKLRERLLGLGLSIHTADIRNTGNGVETRLTLQAGGVS